MRASVFYGPVSGPVQWTLTGVLHGREQRVYNPLDKYIILPTSTAALASPTYISTLYSAKARIE